MLPTWDRILTTGNEWINGVITDRELCFKGADGRRYAIPYTHIYSVDMQREDAFSAHDNVIITSVNGSKQSFQCVGGEIHLNCFKGEQQVHKLRNVSKVAVGIANKLY